ncbi:MAG: cyclic nucleotide-binding domain-containing protein [Myxococcales bacterium]
MSLRPRKDDNRRRRAVARALLVLRHAVSEKAQSASERIHVARAYRILGDTAQAATWYRSAIEALSKHGDAVKALALAKEMEEVMPQEQRAFAGLADRFSTAGAAAAVASAAATAAPAGAAGLSGAALPREPTHRVAMPIFGVAHPIEPDLEDPKKVLDASELLKVHEAESIGASSEAPPVSTAAVPSLVPPDVLAELHSRGEIDLYDEQGQVLDRPDEITGEMEVGEDAIEVLEDSAEGSPADPEDVIGRLEGVPLFSDLDRGAFIELTRLVKLRTVGDRCLIFKEGEDANSFFLVAEGTVEVMRKLKKRDVVLRRFGANEPFGLFGLFAGKKRAANARAVGTASVLEIPASSLANVIRVHPKAKAALSRFFKQRLLENFLASSPIFEDLDGTARATLIAQFRQKRLTPGQAVVSVGEVFNGLFLVVAGRLNITKRLMGAREQELAQLDRGQFFGIVSALSGTPTNCSIRATEQAMLTYLPQKAFNDFIKDYPALRELPRRLSAEGMLVDKDVFVGDAGVPGLS